MEKVFVEIDGSVVKNVYASEKVDVYVRDYDADFVDDGVVWREFNGGYSNSEVEDIMRDEKEKLERRALIDGLLEVDYTLKELAALSVSELKRHYEHHKGEFSL